jgi:hypothetical protein
MKKLILIFFAAITFWGCKKEALNPDCTHGPVFFAGNVAGEKMCLAYLLSDSVIYNNTGYSGGGLGTNWAYKQAAFVIGHRGTAATNLQTIFVNIFADKIPAADFRPHL